MNHSRAYLVLTLILAIFLTITVTGALASPLEWDEGSFLLNAEHLQGTDVNSEPSRPMAISLAVSGIWSLTGESTVAARLLIVLTGLLTVLIFHRLAELEFDNPLPLTAAFAFAPLLLYWSFHVHTDVPALALLLISIYLYRRDKHLPAGVAMAAAVTVRYIFALFAAGMALSYLWDRREFLKYALGGFIGAIPFFLHSTIAHGGPFAKAVMYISRVSRWSGSGPFAATVESLGTLIHTVSPLIVAAVPGWKESPTVEKSMIVLYTVFILFISGNYFHRYWLPLIPLLLLITYRGSNLRIFSLAAGLMILFSGSAVWAGHSQTVRCNPPLDQSLDHLQEKEGAVVSDQWAVAGYTLDTKVYSPWTNYEELRRDYGVEYVHTTSNLSYPLEASFSNDCWTWNIYRLNTSET
ncbi:MAG: glycosyltransferase family 39 protein [Candidatus Nanohaloarchaeota archaeon QJJ-7]|nr:glycosyltransferase family 39 protein [Candidatus Nanohaloarchaeota archaeon QJJ-7]